MMNLDPGTDAQSRRAHGRIRDRPHRRFLAHLLSYAAAVIAPPAPRHYSCDADVGVHSTERGGDPSPYSAPRPPWRAA
jgi:hypothetical protein